MAIQGKKNEMPMGMPNAGSNTPSGAFQQSRSPSDAGNLFLAILNVQVLIIIIQ